MSGNSRKVSISLSNLAESIIDARIRKGRTRSGTINVMISKYHAICRNKTPLLTIQEWAYLVVALKSVRFGASQISTLAPFIKDQIKWNKLNVVGFVGKSLVAKLEALDFAGCAAVIDLVDRYWSAVIAEDPMVEPPNSDANNPDVVLFGLIKYDLIK